MWKGGIYVSVICLPDFCSKIQPAVPVDQLGILINLESISQNKVQSVLSVPFNLTFVKCL